MGPSGGAVLGVKGHGVGGTCESVYSFFIFITEGDGGPLRATEGYCA
jgi:hypothetical protein